MCLHRCAGFPWCSVYTNAPTYHHRRWLLNYMQTTRQMVLRLCSPEDRVSMVSRNVWLIRPQDSLSSNLPQSILTKLRPRAGVGISRGLCMFFLCMAEFLLFVECSDQPCSPAVLFGGCPDLCLCLTAPSEVYSHSVLIGSLDRDFSRFSQYFNIMYHSWWNPQICSLT